MQRTTIFLALWLSGAVWAQSASEYFRQGAHLYAEGRFPSAAIQVREGLSKFPQDQKLQRLLQRIEEAQEQQQEQCNQNNPGNNDEQNQDPQDQKDQPNQEQNSGENKPKDSPPESGDSSAQNPPERGDSNESEPEPSPADSLLEGQLTPEQAAELLQNFQDAEQNQKKQKQFSGRAIPEKDW